MKKTLFKVFIATLCVLALATCFNALFLTPEATAFASEGDLTNESLFDDNCVIHTITFYLLFALVLIVVICFFVYQNEKTTKVETYVTCAYFFISVLMTVISTAGCVGCVLTDVLLWIVWLVTLAIWLIRLKKLKIRLADALKDAYAPIKAWFERLKEKSSEPKTKKAKRDKNAGYGVEELVERMKKQSEADAAYLESFDFSHLTPTETDDEQVPTVLPKIKCELSPEKLDELYAKYQEEQKKEEENAVALYDAQRDAEENGVPLSNIVLPDLLPPDGPENAELPKKGSRKTGKSSSKTTPPESVDLSALLDEPESNEGMTLAQSIATASAAAVRKTPQRKEKSESGNLVFSSVAPLRSENGKSSVGDWLKARYGNDVEVKHTQKYTRTNLPVPDTNYAVKGEKKQCFAYVYELKNGNMFLIVKASEKTAKKIAKKHVINKSRFPKSKEQWWTVVIDDSFESDDDISALLELVYSSVAWAENE